MYYYSGTILTFLCTIWTFLKSAKNDLLSAFNLEMKISKYFWLLLLSMGCERKPRSADLPQRLKTTMAEFLSKSARSDSTHTKFDVQEVVFYEDKQYFDCDFKVHMVSSEKDTTGDMRARITKDFSKVIRTW